jgi:hypothetical protein
MAHMSGGGGGGGGDFIDQESRLQGSIVLQPFETVFIRKNLALAIGESCICVQTREASLDFGI